MFGCQIGMVIAFLLYIPYENVYNTVFTVFLLWKSGRAHKKGFSVGIESKSFFFKIKYGNEKFTAGDTMQ